MDHHRSPLTDIPTGPAAADARHDGTVHDGYGHDQPGRDGSVRLVLWLVLLACAVANMVTSSLGLLVVSVPLGLAVLACVAALVVHHRRTSP